MASFCRINLLSPTRHRAISRVALPHPPCSSMKTATDGRISAGPACPWEEAVTYELHLGTFTQEGTFRSAIPHLRRLAEIGFTAIELMPLAEFPGERGWGYDGVYQYAPHHAYGSPDDFKALVDAASSWNDGHSRRRLQSLRAGRKLHQKLRAGFLSRRRSNPLGTKNRLRAGSGSAVLCR